jgi:predicted RNA binding protein YcfA (HicA-like mRNA interferase family)
MKPKEVERLLKADGWYEIASKGGHRQYKHPAKPGRVTVPWHNRDLAPGTLNSIFRQAQIER